MPRWVTAPVNGIWRLENADYCGHRLTVYRSRAGSYRAHLDGRILGLWRSKHAAIAAAEQAALARSSRREAAPPSESYVGSITLRPKARGVVTERLHHLPEYLCEHALRGAYAQIAEHTDCKKFGSG